MDGRVTFRYLGYVTIGGSAPTLSPTATALGTTLASFLDRATRLCEQEWQRPKGPSPVGASVTPNYSEAGRARTQGWSRAGGVRS